MYFFIKCFRNLSNRLSEYIDSLNLSSILISIDPFALIQQMKLAGPDSLAISIITAFFVSMVFTLQIVKEMLYLNTINIVGAVLALAFIRELSPVLTAVILIGRVTSSYAAELATMKVTEQLNALYLLEPNPVLYLVLPRVLAAILMLPILNLISFVTSIASSVFICSIFYKIDPNLFLVSAFSVVSIMDIIKSSIKMFFFSLAVSILSCISGLSTVGGAYGVGRSTTNAVVCCLLVVFILDFVLSYLMFNHLDSSIKSF
uniref:ABC transporter permease n=1 Tax=Gelidium vagum TaxID=35171 RepID=A0A141SE47_GELVA|nr:hypothetical protein Gvag_112 [Gelidium vagum]AMK96565.1 hypothetical protein Gvag_112 [Gelidium vagum]